jgi:predicted acetyltransferase
VSASIPLRRVEPKDSEALHRLWQLYRHDLSEYRDSVPDQDGVFPVDRLETALADADSEVLLVFEGGTPIGFVLVGGLLADTKSIREFFVVRGRRRRGVGYSAARQVLPRYPGRWRLAFQEENPGGASFWRRVVGELAEGPWSEERIPVPNKPTIPPDTWLTFTVAK